MLKPDILKQVFWEYLEVRGLDASSLKVDMKSHFQVLYDPFTKWKPSVMNRFHLCLAIVK